MNNKIIIAHPAQQHSLKLAEAIDKGGFDYEYITTVYLKDKNLTALLFKFFLKGENKVRASTRRNDALADNKVKQICEMSGLLLLLIQRLPKSKIIYKLWKRNLEKRFSTQLVKYVIKNKVKTIILYDQYAYDFIEQVKQQKYDINIIIDMSAPVYHFMSEIFSTRSCEGNIENIKKAEISLQEIKNANYFIAASSFTKKSLMKYNIHENQILECRYGIDGYYIKDTHSIIEKNDNEKMSIIFIGRIDYKKGGDIYINLANDLKKENISFTALGSVNKTEIVLNGSENCTFKGHVPKSDVIKYLDKSDILILPTFADGFGFVVLEAMARGVVVFCSVNAGVSDIIKDRENGFIFDPNNIEYVKGKIKALSNNQNELLNIKRNAILTAKEVTWEKYNQQVLSSIRKVIS